ncbi:MAG TPA: hypothetical protein VFY93_11430 [Planctomycetota bacterium]|nr:hypothetical protein [Planctomycetota bacterium]
MDQNAARDLLGVAPDAGAAEVLAAYGRRCRRLKQGVMEAWTLEARDRARRALKNLVVLRDIALGPIDAKRLRERRATERTVLVDDWWRPEDGVPMAVPDRAAALRWLGFTGSPAVPTVRRVIDARARGIKLRIARATTDYDLRLWQQTLSDLRRIAAAALGTPLGASDLVSDLEDTMTEGPPRAAPGTP